MTTLDDVKAQHVYLTGKALGLVEKKGADYIENNKMMVTLYSI